MITVYRHSDASRFLKRAMGWLLQNEAENNLILGIAESSQDYQTGHDPMLFATVEDNGRVVGTALRTPPFKLVLSRMPEAGIEPLLEVVDSLYDSLPAVLGPKTIAVECAKQWARRKAISYHLGIHQGIYEATEVRSTEGLPEGKLRRAAEADRGLIGTWLPEFWKDTGLPAGDPEPLIDRLIEKQQLWVWEDKEPRTMIAAVGPTPNGIRVGYVYTPIEHRGNGFATAATAELTSLLLRERRSCFLYTDMANPTSNGIYVRIGYRLIAESVDVIFEPQEW